MNPSLIVSLSLSSRFQRTDVFDNGLTPSVDVRPWTIADTGLVASNIDHVALPSRSWHMIVSLLVRDHDDPVILFPDLFERPAEVGCTVRLAHVERVAQRKSSSRRHLNQVIRKSERDRLLKDFADQNGKALGCVGSEHLRPTRQRSHHAARNVYEKYGSPPQLFLRLERGKHRPLEQFFPMGRMSSRRQKTKRQNAPGVHGLDAVDHERLVHGRLLHVPQIAKQCKRSEFSFSQQSLPCFPLVCTGREGYLPSVGSLQFSFDQLFPQRCLLPVTRFRVAKEQNVAEANRPATIVF